MNTSISKNSWHYKLACSNAKFAYYHSHWSKHKTPIDTCTYIGYVLRELAPLVLMAIIALFGAFSILTFLTTVTTSYFGYDMIIEFVRSNMVVTVAYALGGGVTLAAVLFCAFFALNIAVMQIGKFLKKALKSFNKTEEKVEKPATFFTVAKMKFKEKTCTRVTFVE